MNNLKLIIIAVFLCSCSSWEKITIEPNQCSSEEIVEKFQEKTREVLSKLSTSSRNFNVFSNMEKIRCMGHDFPSMDGSAVCAKKCRPYTMSHLTESSNAVEVVLSHINQELMVVEVAWVPGAIAIPTAAPPKKLSSGLMPAKDENSKEVEKSEKK